MLGAAKALSRLYQGSIKAQLRLNLAEGARGGRVLGAAERERLLI